jgi:hypothetical protein
MHALHMHLADAPASYGNAAAGTTKAAASTAAPDQPSTIIAVQASHA